VVSAPLGAPASRRAELAEEAAVVRAHELLGQSPVVIEPEDVNQVIDDAVAGLTALTAPPAPAR